MTTLITAAKETTDISINVKAVIGFFEARKIKEMLTVGILIKEMFVKVCVKAVFSLAMILGT